MAKSTDDITYVYDVGGIEIKITRKHTGTAYARNGNVHNPTEYFKWYLKINGESQGWFYKRSDAYEAACGYDYCDPSGRPFHYGGSNRVVRPYPLVDREMKANYRGRVRG